MAISDQNLATETTSQFQGRIRNTFLVSLLPISIFFILLMGGISYLRARSAIQNQINTQLDANLAAMARDFDSWLATKYIRLDLAVRKPDIQEMLEAVLAGSQTQQADYLSNRQNLLDAMEVIGRQGEERLFNQFMVVLADGLIITASETRWEGQNIAEAPYFQELVNQPGSLAVYNPALLVARDTVILTSVPYYGGQQRPKAIIITVSPSTSIVRFLEAATLFNPAAQSYIITQTDHFIRVDPYQKIARLETPTEQQLQVLLPLEETHIFGVSNQPYQISPVLSFDNQQAISNYTWLPSLRAGLVIELPQNVAFGELNTLGPYTLAFTLASAALLMVLIWFATNRLVEPIRALTVSTSRFAQGDWAQRAPQASNNEIGLLAHTFNQMAEDLSAIYRSMETQIAERTQSLEKRSQQLEATAMVAREASAIRDLDELLTYTTHLISEHFGFYHTGIFLLDKGQKFAVLQASNSEGGQRMLARSHRLEVGQRGVVGFVAASGQPRIALDVGEDPFFFDNPDLPETRSELALPLKAQNRVIGVLDVQSTEPGAFEGPDVEVLQILSDQIALAIENARLLEQSRTALSNLEQAYGTQTRTAWEKWSQRQTLAFHFDRVQVKPADENQLRALQNANNSTPTIKQARQGSDLMVPIILRGQKLGSVLLRRNQGTQPWTSQEIELIQASLAQIAAALDNTRLLDETRRYAQHEQQLSEFSSRLSQSIDIENILKTAVIQLGSLANVENASIHITQPQNGQAG